MPPSASSGAMSAFSQPSTLEQWRCFGGRGLWHFTAPAGVIAYRSRCGKTFTRAPRGEQDHLPINLGNVCWVCRTAAPSS